MGDYLPLYYHDSTVIDGILTAEAAEFADLNAEITDVLAQYFVDTATWGLTYWERLCGIATDNTKPIEQRRSVVKSQLRGYGTVTVASIVNVAESYVNGSVRVEEFPEKNTIMVRFVDERGAPSNLADIKRIIKEIIPAHLRATFSFTYISWDEIESRGTTWDKISEQTWDTMQPLFSLEWDELDNGKMTWNEAGTYVWNELQAISL